MKMRAVILPDGSVRVFADEGTVESASAKLRQVLSALDLAAVGEVEQHRHADGEVHVHAHEHAQA